MLLQILPRTHSSRSHRPRDAPTTIILIKGHSAELLLKFIFLHPQLSSQTSSVKFLCAAVAIKVKLMTGRSSGE